MSHLKGANTIISMVHHFFEVHSFSNKNWYMMYYLMWRMLTGLHDEIKFSFLPVGYTKFAPDWCFGLMKQCFRHTKIGDIDDTANSMSQSSFFNVPQFVGTMDGTTFVPTYNWSAFFKEDCIEGNLQMHHFKFIACNLTWCS